MLKPLQGAKFNKFKKIIMNLLDAHRDVKVSKAKAKQKVSTKESVQNIMPGDGRRSQRTRKDPINKMSTRWHVQVWTNTQAKE